MPLLRSSPTRPAARHRDAPARILGCPVDPVDADDPDDHDPEGGRAHPPEDRRRRLEQRPHLHAGHHEDDEQPLEHRRQPSHEIRERARRPDGEVADEQHHRLHRDAADQVPGGECEVARGRGRDRDRELRQRSGEREQDQPAELVAQPESRVECIGRLREQDARSPGRGRGSEEDQDEERRAEPGHTETMRAAADGAAPPAAALLQVEPLSPRDAGPPRASRAHPRRRAPTESRRNE